jgi:hypothetical protein
MAKTGGNPRIAIATGQIWKVAESHLMIFRAGPKFIHYRVMAGEPRTKKRTTVASVATVKRLLRSKNAALVWPHP